MGIAELNSGLQSRLSDKGFVLTSMDQMIRWAQGFFVAGEFWFGLLCGRNDALCSWSLRYGAIRDGSFRRVHVRLI